MLYEGCIISSRLYFAAVSCLQVAFGVQGFIADGFNIFDFLTVGMSVIEIVMASPETYSHALAALRGETVEPIPGTGAMFDIRCFFVVVEGSPVGVE